MTLKTLLELQEIYVQDRTREAYNELYRAVLVLSKGITTNKLKKAKCYDRDKANLYALDATAQFMMMYVKNPDWRCKFFKTRLAMDVFHVLHNKSKCNDYSFYANTTVFTGRETVEETVRQAICIMDVLKEDKDSKAILLLNYKSDTFRLFLLNLGEIKPIWWIRENLKGLESLYKHTRIENGKSKERKQKGDAFGKGEPTGQRMV